MTRNEKEKLLWKSKHKDYKVIGQDGHKKVLHLDSKTGSTILIAIKDLTDDELNDQLKYIKNPCRVKNPSDLSDLAGFTGGGNQYKHWLPGIQYTEGIKYVADKAGAYWLIDLVASYNNTKFRARYPFQVWTLKKTPQDKRSAAVATMKEDSGQPEVISQKISYTDFPLDKFEFYSIDGTIMLKSEY